MSKTFGTSFGVLEWNPTRILTGLSLHYKRTLQGVACSLHPKGGKTQTDVIDLSRTRFLYLCVIQ